MAEARARPGEAGSQPCRGLERFGGFTFSRLLPHAGSSCLVAYKKTPPPVPPRTTSKPFISVTVQSSTESAQDTYLDSQDHKSEVTSQSGLSNSSDSLDSSTRPPSVTRGGVVPTPEAPEPPPKHAALKSDQGTLTSSESHSETIPKRKLSSIGIQVGTSFALPSVDSVHLPVCNYIWWRTIRSPGRMWSLSRGTSQVADPYLTHSYSVPTLHAAESAAAAYVAPVNVVTLSQPSPVHCLLSTVCLSTLPFALPAHPWEVGLA